MPAEQKAFPAKQETKPLTETPPEADDDTRLSLLSPVNYRIMEQLKQSYPTVAWLWEARPSSEEIKMCIRDRHKSILLLFRQADTYLAQFNQHLLDHIRCAQMTNILGSPMKPHNLFRLCTAVLCQHGRISGWDFLVVIQIEPLVQIEKRKLV